MQRNRLAAETSPYLLQHADNPVDWYPWGEAALTAALAEDKPILLSVGYSACHWCHVMAHESFEDADIAALMNRLFINIKVDREERPDLDKIYQLAQQLLTQGNGGWPLTMFLTPGDQRPFFGGTYFSKQPRHGLPGFAALLERVAGYFRSHRSEIEQQNAELVRTLERLAPAPPDGAAALDDMPLLAARYALDKSFDSEYGGFGGAPKFPQPGSIERCLRHWHGTAGGENPDLKALYMATLTLTRMAEGGIYDQLGGGFSRYSTDRSWAIPHFEKMLYDNAQLLTLYASAYQATGEPLFARIAGETADWLLRDMRGPQGAFFSSLDADSEGREGAFYVWDREEIKQLLTNEEFTAFAWRFGLDRDANFEGYWHLHAHESLERLVKDGETSIDSVLDAARAKLLAARGRRIAPARDEKILTSWNALTVKALAIAGRVLKRPDLIAAAGAAVDAIRSTLWQGGRLLATAKDGHAHLSAYLDDYAFLAEALLELLQSRWRSSDLEFAQSLVEVLLAQFEDPVQGGFYFTAADHESLILRIKSFSDDSLPGGNGSAVTVLCRMGYLLGELRYLDAAERALKGAERAMLDHPDAHMGLLNGLEEFLSSSQIIIIRGRADDAARWATELNALYSPARMVFAIPEDAADLPPALSEKRAIGGTTAYLCTGMTCSQPLDNMDAVARLATANLAR
jgi:uncharacterized protein YyaL (SSP411 family)